VILITQRTLATAASGITDRIIVNVKNAFLRDRLIRLTGFPLLPSENENESKLFFAACNTSISRHAHDNANANMPMRLYDDEVAITFMTVLDIAILRYHA